MSDLMGEAAGASTIVTESEFTFSRMDSLLFIREQPLLELSNSEESYVQRLQFVCDTYIPIVQAGPLDLLPHSPTGQKNTHAPSGAPQPPPDLAAKWRILWGNWYQLTEWHTQFSEKLKALVHSHPDAIPELFLSSCTRMRSMYMKYCENHLKAIALVAQHKTYFEELRMYFFDRDDILSHLMQPIQRVTRYQLPMVQALKITERANAPSREVWREAVSILKDIPNDIQMIMEAAKIVGFPGSITNLGHLRLFSAMYVARITRKEMQAVLSAAKVHDHYDEAVERQPEESRMPQPNSGKGRTFLSPSQSLISPDPEECEFCRKLSKVRKKARKSLHLRFSECRVFLFDQSLLITDDEASNELSPAGRLMSRFAGDFGRVVRGSRSLTYRLGESPQYSERGTSPQSPPSWPSKGSYETVPAHCLTKSHTVRATSVSRVISASVGSETRGSGGGRSAFHLRRHTSAIHADPEHHRMPGPTSHTAAVIPSAPTLNDPFRHSAYTFQHAIKVNRMSFMPHWLASELTIRNLLSESFLFRTATDEAYSPLRRQENFQGFSKQRFNGFSFTESDKEMQDSESPESSANSGTGTVSEVGPLYAETLSGGDKYSPLASPLLTERLCSCSPYLLSTTDNADRLWFAVSDESPGSDAVFIFDPGSAPVRDVWLAELKDIQQMQADIQLALQNPKRFIAAIGRPPHSMLSLTNNFYEHKPRLKYQASALELRSHASPHPWSSLEKNHLDPKPLHVRGVSAPTMTIKKEDSLEEIVKIQAINFTTPVSTAYLNLTTNIVYM
uniref:DH domain-containing protein n=2 Tax=Schistocephalus solidus TaxID=70667 RepID=A0A0V0JB43_SCHSO